MTHAPERNLVIVGDEAYSDEEWAEVERRRQRKREYQRHRYHTDPEYRRRRVEWMRAYSKTPAWRAYKREWMRRARSNKPHLVASLHGLACSGPTRATGCICQKIKCYDRPWDVRDPE